MASAPLFILGAHRSGTTWLANALCNHPQIFGIQAPEYGGIVESWYFSHLDGRFGRLEQRERYLTFLDTFRRTPFFRASGVPLAQLKDLAPTGYNDFYLNFMRAGLAARRTGARFLLEKTPVHTLYAATLARAFPDSFFVTITRAPADVVASALKLRANKGQLLMPEASLRSIAALVFHRRRYQAYIDRFSRLYPNRFLNLEYESLRADPQGEFRRCLNFIDLPWDDRVLQSTYRPNSSFQNASTENRQASETLSRRQLQWVAFSATIARRVPYQIFNLWETLRPPRNQEPIPFLLPEPAPEPFSSSPAT